MKAESARQGEKVFAKALRLFFFIFLAIGMTLAGGVFVFYTYQTKGFVDGLLSRERYSVGVRQKLVEDGLHSVATDLDYLATSSDVKRFARSGDPSLLSGIAQDFYDFVKAKGVYDQARLLGANGMELVRVNYNGGLPDIVPQPLLQGKSKRYYFSDTAQLSKGEIFVSPLDLNIEDGEVEIPFKPMIRIGTPLYGDDGAFRGILLLNYLADNLLGSLRRLGQAATGQTMLLDSRGYWLLAPNPKDQWGFMFDGRKDDSFAVRHPRVWIDVRAGEHGQVVKGGKIFTFTTIRPLDTQFHSSMIEGKPFAPSVQALSDEEYFWKLVSYVPDSLSQGYSNHLLGRLFTLGALLFMVTATGSWLLALAVARRRLYQARLVEMAHVDILTGLPNRRLFFDRLDQIFVHSERYGHGFALLYVDVDDFKGVNDALGHEAGDELLVHLGKRLQKHCRRSDTVARIGGDEFVVILPQVESREACKAVADKIVQSMTKPFKLGGRAVSVTLSIGVAMYPDDSSDRNELLNLSDRAMYKAKLSGKDQVSFKAS